MASILFSKSDFSSEGGSGKEYSKQNWEINITKIVDKLVENLTRGR